MKHDPTFLLSVRFVLAEEGGFVNHPDDPGGATKFGISLRAHREDIGDLDGDGDVDEDDVRLVTPEMAIQIYEREYWAPIRGSEYVPPVAIVMLDTAVNCGTVRAVKLLQRALLIPEDGIIGRGTRAAVLRESTRDADAVVRNILRCRMAFYQGLRTWPKFGRGWTARVRRLEATVDQFQGTGRIYA